MAVKRLKWTSKLRKLEVYNDVQWTAINDMIRAADRILDYAIEDDHHDGMWLVTDTDMRLAKHTRVALKALVEEIDEA